MPTRANPIAEAVVGVGYHDPDCPGSRYDYEKREVISAPCGGAHDYLQVYGYRLITDWDNF